MAKLVYSVKSEKTNAWKFVEKSVRIPNGENELDVLKKAMDGQGK